MKFPVLTKSRVGFSVALVSVLTLVGVEVCGRVLLLPGRVATACVGFGCVGLLLWFKGRLGQSRQETGKTAMEAATRSNLQDHPFAFLKSFQYWGFILATSAVLVYFITPKPRTKAAAPLAAIAKPVELPPPTNVPPETNALSAVVFPPLKLRGLVYNGDDSTAVINGRTLQVDEYLGEVKVVAIEAKRVTVELSGERMVLHLVE